MGKKVDSKILWRRSSPDCSKAMIHTVSCFEWCCFLLLVVSWCFLFLLYLPFVILLIIITIFLLLAVLLLLLLLLCLFISILIFFWLPSLKLTAKAPENGWLEYDRLPLEWPIFSFREGKCLPKWWFQIFLFSPLGEIIQFDDHIFQMGWFNHQLVTYHSSQFVCWFSWNIPHARYGWATCQKALVGRSSKIMSTRCSNVQRIL